ncbi:MAG TPA: DNA mismatch endonuclease Vsr [Thermoanaerobaculia bacterium]|nr:DNA mismatch endonuclease Vsr [Thermoanaerobaculia bacterium]
MTRRRPSKHSLTVDAETSARLGRIRQQGTSPELTVRRIIHRLGLRFRVANRDLPGSPDIANRSRKWAIFVHGCFWHRHRGCVRATTPTRNREFWLAKFRANVARDDRTSTELRRSGWKVIIVWECEVENGRALSKLRRIVP